MGPIVYAGITIYLPIFFRYRDYSFEEKFVCIKLMKMNAKDYGISIIFGQNIWRGICFLAPLVIIIFYGS